LQECFEVVVFFERKIQPHVCQPVEKNKGFIVFAVQGVSIGQVVDQPGMIRAKLAGLDHIFQKAGKIFLLVGFAGLSLGVLARNQIGFCLGNGR
jgi:hypothetical protein